MAGLVLVPRPVPGPSSEPRELSPQSLKSTALPQSGEGRVGTNTPAYYRPESATWPLSHTGLPTAWTTAEGGGCVSGPVPRPPVVPPPALPPRGGGDCWKAVAGGPRL